MVGRKRTTGKGDLPPGMRVIGGRYYYEPTTQKDRAARITAGLPITQPLGPDLETARRKWAEIKGYAKPREDGKAGTVDEILDRLQDEVIPRRKRDGSYKLADKTRKEYERQLVPLRARFGKRRYARTDVEASRGGSLTTLDVQQWLDRATAPVEANRQFSLLRNAFKWARRWGLTFYNPCLGALAAETNGKRERVPAPWEYEVLLACANYPMSLMLRHVHMTGWREGDTRLLHRFQLKPDGIYLRQSKRGARQLWEWTPELRALIDEALERPEAKRAKGLKDGGYIYVSREAKPLTLSGFQSNWRRLIARANRLLRESCDWPQAPQIADLIFHDHRAEAGELADDPTKFLGHSDPRVTKRHYLRSPTKVKPLRR